MDPDPVDPHYFASRCSWSGSRSLLNNQRFKEISEKAQNFIIFYDLQPILEHIFSMAMKMSRYDPVPAGAIKNWPLSSGSVIRITDSRIRIRKKYLRIHNTEKGISQSIKRLTLNSKTWKTKFGFASTWKIRIWTHSNVIPQHYVTN